jgi:hypothetical protein
MIAPIPPAEPGSGRRADSLIGQIGGLVRRQRSGSRVASPALPGTLRFVLLVVALSALVVTIGAVWQARRADADGRALADQTEASVRDRERAAELADALALPRFEAVLGSIAAHLPPGVMLVEAARAEDGALRLAIDTPDPDALRAALAGDPQLRRFRERAQAVRDDGTIRVRLEGSAR